ncbi:hypothetical protein T484DRAFT_1772995 [Baffinella frigidus]|nr:hypothetical protein T484DRAFT_1772995 [Cryptophyta sp. CCMP2293]
MFPDESVCVALTPRGREQAHEVAHEVVGMRSAAGALADMHQAGTVVEVGSGKGYLAHALALQGRL